MRRVVYLSFLAGTICAASAFSAPQQEPPKEPPKEQLNLQLPPPPPPPEIPAKREITPPEKLFLPAGPIAVQLDTPVSTRITKKGQEVVFLTAETIRLAEDIELPLDTRIIATVVQAKKPGIFGRPGAMKIKIERIEVESQSVPLTARLEGVDANAGKVQMDSSRAADLYTLATWGLSGTVLGANIGGGKGAAIGAGAGVAAAILIGMSRRGPDLYLEPGTPFSVVLEEPVELRGADVYAAQQKYDETHPRRDKSEDEMLESLSDPSKPQLKRRPKNP